MLKALIFDLDETLLDWSGQVDSWEEYQDDHLGRVFDFVDQTIQPLDDREAFLNAVAGRIVRSWSEAKTTYRAPHLGEILLETLVAQGGPSERLDIQACLDAYAFEPFPGVLPYPDVIPELKNFQQHGLRFGLVTNSMHPMTLRDRELEAAGLLPFFESGCRISAADVGVLKPEPRIFQQALDTLGIGVDEAIFVGDNLHADIAGAQQVGMKAVLRSRHYQPNGIIPDGIIHSLADLYPLLDAWYADWRS